MKLMKKIMLPFLCATLISPALLAKNKPLDKIEAVVNQEIILSSDLQRMSIDIRARYKEKKQTLPTDNELNRQILDKLINDRLQLQIADRMGLRINDAQVNQTVQQIVKKEGKTITQYQLALASKGQSYDAFVDNIRDELTINEIRQIQVRRRINISDQEVEQMVKRINEQGEKTTQFNFVHILLKTTNHDTIEKQLATKELAQKLVERINKGESASTLASQYSQGPKASEGGDWGWRTINEIPSLVANKFDDLNTKKGELIGPFQTSLGLSIIKVMDKKGTESIMTVEVNARHILIKSNIILSDEKAEKLLNEYRKQILEGSKTFAQLATEYSQDPGSAVKGGELGWADPSMYVPEFRDVALSLNTGEISKAFRTMHGWHILEVLGKRESDTTEQATKQKAYSLLYQQRFPAEVYAWLNEIRQEAYIKINNPDYITEEK